jgi:hypothetical protein
MQVVAVPGSSWNPAGPDNETLEGVAVAAPVDPERRTPQGS